MLAGDRPYIPGARTCGMKYLLRDESRVRQRLKGASPKARRFSCAKVSWGSRGASAFRAGKKGDDCGPCPQRKVGGHASIPDVSRGTKSFARPYAFPYSGRQHDRRSLHQPAFRRPACWVQGLSSKQGTTRAVRV